MSYSPTPCKREGCQKNGVACCDKCGGLVCLKHTASGANPQRVMLLCWTCKEKEQSALGIIEQHFPDVT